MISDQNGLSELPNAWMWTRLEDCVDVLDSHRVPLNAQEREKRIAGKSISGLYPYYGATGQVGWIDGYLFDEELVLLGEDGAPFFAPAKNKAYIIRGQSWVNNHAHVLRALAAITSNTFLCHYLNIFDYNGYVTGTTRMKLNQSPMRKIPIPLPPLPEQHRIVAKIEELFTKLDAGADSLKKVKAQLKRYRQSVLKYAFEGKLTEEWRERHRDELESASMLLENIKEERKRNAKRNYKELPPVDTSDFPEVPEGWCYTYLKPLLSINRSGLKTGPFGSLLKKHEHQPKGVPVLGIENISSMRFIPGSKIHITEEKAQQLPGYDAQPGDVLISRSGTVGEVCVIPEGIGNARISTNVIRVTLAPEGMLPHFFCFLFNGSPFVLSQVSELCKGSTRDFLNQTILSSIIFPLPPLGEQKRIIAEVERRFSVADKIKINIDQNYKRAERLRQSILKRAFEGKLVPQDSTDEPASVLLERIIAEKKNRKLEIKSKPTKNKRKSELVQVQKQTRFNDYV